MIRRFSALFLLVSLCLPGRVVGQSFRDATHLILDQPDIQRVLVGASSIDVNRDGLVDIYHLNRLYIQQDDGTFVNEMPPSGLVDGIGDVQGGIWSDINGDGFVDVFLPNRSGASRLYRNDRNGRFTIWRNAPEMSGGAMSAVWADVNVDGLLDLFVTHEDGLNALFQRTAGDGFVNRNTAARVLTHRKTCGVSAGDYDVDGDQDFYLSICDTETTLRMTDAVLQNRGNGIFVDAVEAGDVSPNRHNTRGTIWVDVDNDGLVDVFALNHVLDPPPAFVEGHDVLLRNNGGGKLQLQSTSAGGDAYEQGYSAVTADFDNDGWQDIVVINWPAENFEAPTDDHFFRNLGNGSFEDVFDDVISDALGTTELPERAVVTAADYDDDGWVDLFFASAEGSRLLLNDGGTRHWSKIGLRGPTINYHAVGARLELYQNGAVQVREIRAGEGFASQNHDLSAHFGLGDNARIDSVVVRWPDRSRSVVYDPPSDRELVIAKDEGINLPPGKTHLQEPRDGADIGFDVETLAFDWEDVLDPEGQEVTYRLIFIGPGLDAQFGPYTESRGIISTDHFQQGQTYRWTVLADDGLHTRRATERFAFSYAGSLLPEPVAGNLKLPGLDHGDMDLADIDGDEDLDLILTGRSDDGPVTRLYEAVDTTVYEGAAVYEFKIFREIHGALSQVEMSSARFGDYDGDGDADLVLTGAARGEQGPLLLTDLYRNTGSIFVKDQRSTLPGTYEGDAEWADFDGDGDLDLLLGGASTASSPYDPFTALYENDGTGRFTDTGQHFLPMGFGDAAFGDFDDDGDPDLAVIGDRGMGAFAARIYRNDFGRFVEHAALPGLAFGSLSWGDLDSDGDLDLLITGGRFDPELLRGTARIYRNEGGSFVDIGPQREFIQVANGAGLWTDFERDGDVDIVLVGAEKPLEAGNGWIYRNEAGRFAQEFRLTALTSATLVAGDYNADGDVDVIAMGRTTAGDRVIVVHLNQINFDNIAPGFLSE